MVEETFKVRKFILVAVFVFLALVAVLFPGGRLLAAASLVISPNTAVISSGTQFTMSVMISSDQPVNAAQGTVTFPTDRLRVVQVSKTGSIFQFWSDEPSFSNANGTVNFGGGLPSPGFTGQGGTVLRITFQAFGSGTAPINIVQGAVLANDGQGTNVLNNIVQAVYTIGPAPAPIAPAEIANQITSRAYPNSGVWYNQSVADFSWVINQDVDRVAYDLSRTSGAEPSQGYEPIDHAQYELADRQDGIWHFNLQIRTRGTWGKLLTKQIKIDRTPPSAPQIQNLTEDLTDPRPIFTWTAHDATSGIRSYRLRVGEGEWLTPTPQNATRMTLPPQPPGKHKLTVEAADFAGNTSASTMDFEIKPIAQPSITEYPRSFSATEPDAAQRIVVVKGRASGAQLVKVYLRNGDNELVFSSPVATDGSWGIDYVGTLSPGTWKLTAQAEDSRGALSLETKPILISTESTMGNLIRFFASWGVLGLVMVLALVLICFTIIASWARLKHYRLKLKREIVAAQIQLIKDFEQVEKDLDGRSAKARREVTKDMDVLAKDIGKELEKLRKDVE